MAGLAIGSYAIGRKIDLQRKLLRIFGLLELGIGLYGLVFFALMRIYPPIYISLAQLLPDSMLYLGVIRFTLAVIALIIPTSLMGGTLPVLTAFTNRLMQGAGTRLSFLYGCNTLGAVIGAAVTGFVVLRSFSLGQTLAAVMTVNLFAGAAAILLHQLVARSHRAEEPAPAPVTGAGHADSGPEASGRYRLISWGIGLSGFCAMGYEVLWNRVLSIAIGASTYAFTLLLVAFLAGIGLGSASFGFLCRFLARRRHDAALARVSSAATFGAVQITIGATALLASTQFRFLPAYVASLHDYFLDHFQWLEQFQLIQFANFVLAFSIMFVPAFFMGVAFPLAGMLQCRYRRQVGCAVGEVLSFNTLGAILGAGGSGFLLIYLFGIQRSLQLLILLNCGYGAVVIAAARSRRMAAAAALLAAASLLLPLCVPDRWHLWNPKLFAIYQSNKPEEYGSTEELQEMLANIDVRYYAEGAQSIVSSVQSNETLFFITNGRVEASNAHVDMQCQYVLGHLPMLLHKDPRQVFVLGTGSGMTLGAVSVHPGVERMTLAEIEPGVIGVARTFGVDNHYVLNKPDPRLKIVFNDGRNHLLTTRERYDVITADPVHPWFSGAGYLYSTEYFRLAASRLKPGGIICQWLPLYELTAEDLRSVVATIRKNFAYTMIWVTHYDAEIVASNSPIVIDEQEIGRRIASPQVLLDLRQIRMGSAEDFLSFFVMGDKGTAAYSRGGRINTDDNLFLEFSAPRSIGKEYLRGPNLQDLLQNRESILPYLRQPENPREQALQKSRWEANNQAALLEDKVHVLEVSGQFLNYRFTDLATELEDRYPRYAPWRFSKEETGDEKSGASSLLKEESLPLLDENGTPFDAQFTAILVRKSDKFARVFFVDDKSRTVFGKLRVKGRGRERYIERFVAGVMQEVRRIYAEEAARAAAAGMVRPALLAVFPKIKTLVEARIDLE
jgi:spermidine synthase